MADSTIAILLGAPHGLEPGHSKTIMAAFIIAIRGILSFTPLTLFVLSALYPMLAWRQKPGSNPS
jgi:nickel/cobalt exporter